MSTSPIILLAPGRCFSSLICAMLGQHPQLYALLETQLLVRESMEEWLNDFGTGIHSHGLLRAVSEIIFGGQTSVEIRRASRWLERRQKVKTSEVLCELTHELGPLRLVEKSPMLTYRPEHMKRAAKLFPNAHFIHLTRHPVGYGTSLLEFFRNRAPLDNRRRVVNMLADRESIFYGLFDQDADPPAFDPQNAWHLRHSEVKTFTSRSAQASIFWSAPRSYWPTRFRRSVEFAIGSALTATMTRSTKCYIRKTRRSDNWDRLELVSVLTRVSSRIRSSALGMNPCRRWLSQCHEIQSAARLSDRFANWPLVLATHKHLGRRGSNLSVCMMTTASRQVVGASIDGRRQPKNACNETRMTLIKTVEAARCARRVRGWVADLYTEGGDDRTAVRRSLPTG